MDEAKIIEDALFNLPTINSATLEEEFLKFENGDNSNIPRCGNCGKNDWITDYERGDIICADCGCCSDRLFCVQPTKSDKNARMARGVAIMEETIHDMASMEIYGGRKRKSNSVPYNPSTYQTERLAQWALTEPAIPDADWELIEGEFTNYVYDLGYEPILPTPDELQNSRGRAISGCVILTKQEIKTILTACDTVIADVETVKKFKLTAEEQQVIKKHRKKMEKNCDDYVRPKVDEEPYQPPATGFVGKYLEKWLTIRWRFSGVGTCIRELPVWALEFVRENFKRVVETHRNVVAYTGRKNINHNNIYARLLELCGCGHLRHEFEPPKRKETRKAVYNIWWLICKFNKWPYINSDEREFGEAKSQISKKKRKKRVRFEDADSSAEEVITHYSNRRIRRGD